MTLILTVQMSVICPINGIKMVKTLFITYACYNYILMPNDAKLNFEMYVIEYIYSIILMKLKNLWKEELDFWKQYFNRYNAWLWI